jgi:hypothetical protein
MALLIARRSFSIFGNAELGGPKGPKIITGIFLICRCMSKQRIGTLFAHSSKTV